jgi:hypothetical protein
MTNPFGARFGALAALTALAIAAPAGAATPATLSRSVEVSGGPAAVWAKIGPFCAIADWHPAIATCVADGKAAPTRTLTTKDQAKFVELQTAHDREAHRYSYTFVSSPVPVTHYTSTFSVRASGPGRSTVTWRGAYLPNPGQEQAAQAALSGIYESGLAAIKTRLAAAAD